MRKIKTTDVFSAMRLIQRSGLKEKFVPVIKSAAETEDDVVGVGIIGVLSVIEVFAEAQCESMVYDWLSGPLEKSPEEIADMDLDVLTENLEELGRENDLKRFFTALSGLLTKKH